MSYAYRWKGDQMVYLLAKVSFAYLRPQELDVDNAILVYPLRSKGKDGHSAAAQIVSG